MAAGEPLPRRAERLRRREHTALRAADGLLCLTDGVRRAVGAAFDPAAPALVLPRGTVLPGEAAPPDPQGARDIDLLYVGKIEARKGVPLLVEAMRHLPGRRLWIVGGDPEAAGVLEARAREAGVADRIVCAGFVEPARVGAYLRRARVGLCPLAAGVSVTTDEFTSPLKALELMAHGVPLVASDLPSVRELAEHDRTAVLVRPDDPVALAGAVRSLFADPARGLLVAGARFAPAALPRRPRRPTGGGPPGRAAAFRPHGHSGPGLIERPGPPRLAGRVSGAPEPPRKTSHAHATYAGGRRPGRLASAG